MKKFLFLFSFIALLCLPWVGRAQTIVNFESGDLSGLSAVSTSVTNDATYPWVVTSNAPAGFNGTYCMKSSNSGVASSSSTIEITVTFTGNGSISFLGGCWGEGSYTAWDKCIFAIDGVQQFANGALAAWGFYTYEVTAGTHTFTWSYTKDSSVDPTNDAFYVDDITFELGNNPCAKPTELAYSNVEAHSAMLSWNANGTSSWQICLNGDEENLIDATSNPYTLNGLLSEAPYTVKVRANCGSDGYSYWSSPVSFTTSIACAKPTNLTATITPGNGSIATLSWTAADANASWVLQYGTDNTFAAGTYVEENVSGTPTINLTGLTAETTYYARVSAICDNSESSQWSSVCSFTPTDAYRIGSGTATNTYLPSYNYYNYSLSQQIYTSEEIQTSGTINSIAFYNAGTEKTRNYDIYLVNTDKESFANASDWITVTDQDLVFSGDVTMVANDWTVINFNTDFVYDVNFNLALIVDDNTGSYSSYPHMSCLVFTDSSNALYYYNDNTNLSPLTSITTSGTLSHVKNQILLGLTPSGQTCVKPTGLTVSNITGHTADISWDGGEATAWQICLAGNEDNPIDVTESSYSFTGLTPTTSYTVKVRTNCTDEETVSTWATTTFTTDVACPTPTNMNAEVSGNAANLSWNGSADSYNVRYIVASEIPAPTVTLTAGNVWQDGTGYQMLLDADADTYGTIIPTSGALTEGDDVADEIYAEFEYKIPVNADGALSTSNIVLDTNITITIPAGTYDWCITNPTPGDRMWIASSNGNIGGRADDYVFEDGKAYEFTVSIGGTNDQVDVTISYAADSTLEWTVLNNVTSPLAISNLLVGTDYVWQVQGVCDGEPSAWSDMSTFTTDAAIIPTFVNIEGDTFVCPGSTTTLTATTDVEATFTWSNGETGATVTVPAGITYTVTATSVTGNELSESVTVSAYPTYEVADELTLCQNELPYEWNTVTFTEAGTQVVTLQTVNGCDSIVTMTLNVNPTYEVADEAIICESELPYVWNTVIFTEAGTQIDTLPTVNGCDSIVTMTLVVKPTMYGIDGWTICENELPYTWNGIVFTEAGTQFDTLTAANGCDSIVAMTLIVKPGATGTDAKTICSSLLPYEWNGVTFEEAGTQVATLEAANGCDSVVTMTLVVNPAYNINETRTVCTSALPYTWNGVTFEEAGTQVLSLQTIEGCDSIITMTVNVSTAYEVEETQVICANLLPYEWNGVTFTEADTQSVTLQSSNNCDSIVTMILVINPVYSVSDTKEICMNELPYTWDNITFNGNGTEIDTMQTINGCDSIVTKTLIVHPTYISNDIAYICQGESYEFFGRMLTETGFYTDTLPTVFGCDSIFTLDLTVYPTYNNTTITHTMCEGDTCYFLGKMYTESGTYLDTLPTIHGCDSVITFVLTVNHPVHTAITETACDSYVWHNIAYTESGEYTFSHQDSNGCTQVDTLHLTVNYSNTGVDVQTACDSYTWIDGQTYTASTNTPTFTLTNAAGCDSVVTLNLTINYSNTGVDVQTACESYTWIDGQTYTASTSTPTFTLTNAAGCDSVVTLNLTINNPVHTAVTETACNSYVWNNTTYTETGVYTYSHQDANGCTQVDTLHLTVNYSNTGVDVQTACDSYTWIDGQTYTASTNTPTFTLTNAAGCDSVVTLNLTINYSNTGVDVQTACNSFTWIDGQTYTASTNTPTFTLTNAAGCDSVVTLNLTINNSTTGTDVRTVCESELPYTWNGVTFMFAGTETATLTAANGCDSVVTMTLNVNPIYYETAATTICSSELPYTWNGVVFTEAGTQSLSLQTVDGCDSIIYMTLTVNMVDAITLTESACEQYEWNGQTYIESGDYTQTFTNAAGCDSVVTLHLTINHSATSEFTIETSDSCYVWNDQTYCESGDYTQTLTTAAGCDSVVTLHLTTRVGVEEYVLDSKLFIAPNPATNVCRILGLDTDPVSVDLYDMNGKLVRRHNSTVFDVSTLPTGIYMVRVYTGEQIVNLKLVKE